MITVGNYYFMDVYKGLKLTCSDDCAYQFFRIRWRFRCGRSIGCLRLFLVHHPLFRSFPTFRKYLGTYELFWQRYINSNISCVYHFELEMLSSLPTKDFILYILLYRRNLNQIKI